jgi:DNA modification methylase
MPGVPGACGQDARMPEKKPSPEKRPMKLAVGVLKADPQNARTIEAPALRGLGVSMETFGDLSGIVWNERSGNLVAGHQRMNRLRAAGASEWHREGDRGWIAHPKTGQRFDIRIVDWDATTERMANLTANNPAIQGEFTEEAAAQLAALEDEVAFEVLRLGELKEDLDREVKAAEDRQQGNGDPDDAPAPPPEPTTRRGDLWLLGDHRLLCGDSTDGRDVARLMDGQRAVLMNTDPPYGVDYTATKAGMPVSGVGDAQDRWGDIENDALTPEQLERLLLSFLRESSKRLVETAAVYVWHPPGELNHVFRSALLATGHIVHRQIIWEKPGFVLTRSGMYHWAHETCFFGWRQGKVPPWYGEKNQTSVWAAGRDDGKSVHPTQKPVALFEIPMANHTRKGEICYEPFSGSGSQIVAGERLGRRVFAMELSPRWVDAAVARWEAFTGRRGVREPAGK